MISTNDKRIDRNANRQDAPTDRNRIQQQYVPFSEKKTPTKANTKHYTQQYTNIPMLTSS